MDGESTREFQEEQDAGEETESPGDETASLQRVPAGSVYMAGGSASVKDGSPPSVDNACRYIQRRMTGGFTDLAGAGLSLR